jgi:hypothetical protein
MPRLYLELIENKDKIKQNLVNKEYDPDDAASDITYFGGHRGERAYQVMSDIEEDSDEMDSTDVSSMASDTSSVRMPAAPQPSPQATPPQATPPQATQPPIKSGSVASFGSSATEDETDMDMTDEDEDDDSDNDSQKPAQPANVASFQYPQQQPQPQQQTSKSQQYAKILNESLPPKLSDLERQGEIQNRQSVPNLDRIYATEDEEDEMKRELLFKFELLKKAYKTDVPEFNVHSDLKQMTRSYESTLRRVSLDSCVENYKQLLIGGFMVLEFVLGYLFKFDMQGFTQQQILNMNQYERLLIELGEQSYVPGGSQWPVEVRLLLMVLGNAAIFIIAKMIMKKTGSNIMSAMNSFSRPQPNPLNKRKMRGPSIQPDDIPDISTDEF